jgi:ribosomal-protein-alanine N-acetyltransferase
MDQNPRSFLVLETARLILRRQLPDDVPALTALWTDPEATRHMGGPRNRAEMRAEFERVAGNPFADAFDLWPVVEKETGRVAGHCGLLDKRIEDCDEIELVYVFAPSAWGRGYATEMALALREWAETALGLRRLVALIDPENPASERVAQKAGFRCQKTISRPGGHLRKLYLWEAS